MESKVESKVLFKVIFINQGKVYEIYARSVSQSAMLGFVTIEDFVFGESSAVVIDPSEEKLKLEFGAVKRSYIPMHSVIRIDEVEKEGPAKIVKLEGDNPVVNFPGTFYNSNKTPRSDPGSDRNKED